MEHGLARRLEQSKSEWQAQLARDKVAWDEESKIKAEALLGDLAATRNYTWEARKRLHAAVGPLQFQLLLACRDFAARIHGHGMHPTYSTGLDTYYGQSTLYRLLRPLVICELVERQIAFADFSVDKIGMEIIRFSKAAMSVLSGSTLVGAHPNTNWKEQREHAFYDSISRAIDALIVREDGKDRCIRFSEFALLSSDTSKRNELHPFPRIFEDFSVSRCPIFWLRLIAYGNLCADFVNRVGANDAMGFYERQLDIEGLLNLSHDDAIKSDLRAYAQRCRDVTAYRL
ncbi:hypothetical protein [Cupriavidus taiwanensis]|uniref:hypothetical protein n=1 Tax=Cupriavidus taiwanensis TaxID=164546 RepID=UPI0039C110F2